MTRTWADARPAAVLLLLLLEVALLDTGTLTATVAVAATAAAGSAFAACSLIVARCAPSYRPPGSVRPSATATAARPSCRNAIPTPADGRAPGRPDTPSRRPRRHPLHSTQAASVPGGPPLLVTHPETSGGSPRVALRHG